MSSNFSLGFGPQVTRAAAASLAFFCSTAVFAQAPPVVDDQTRSAARALTEQGLALFDARNYLASADKLRRADELVRLPTTGLNLARAYAKSGKLLEACEKYLAVTKIVLDASAAAAQGKAQQTAERERATLLPLLASLEIVLDPPVPDAVVSLDGLPVPKALVGVARPVNPGEHSVEARAGSEVVTRNVMLRESGSERLVLKLKLPERAAEAGPALGAPGTDGASASPRTASPPVDPGGSPAAAIAAESPRPSGASVEAAESSPTTPGTSGLRVVGGVLTGLGGAAVVTGGILGLMTQSTVNDLVACTDDPACTRAEQEVLHDQATVRQRNTFIALGVGAGVAATGVVLLVLAPSSEEAKAKAAQSSFRLSPTGASFRYVW